VVEEGVGGEEGREAAADGGEGRERGAGDAGEALEEELVGQGGNWRSLGGWVGGAKVGGGGWDGDGGVAVRVGGDAGPGEPGEAAGVAALPGHEPPDRELGAQCLRTGCCIAHCTDVKLGVGFCEFVWIWLCL
jgi:hypothetical protein